MEINYGFCQCGCGKKAPIAKKNHTRSGYIKGQLMRYIHGHYARAHTGSDSPSWKGGKTLSTNGYILIWKPEHPRVNCCGYVAEHILIAEEVLGKPLPKGAVIHHVNENRSDNRKENLIICENEAYHQVLHRRLRAYKACGHASWRKCQYCKTYDHPNLLIVSRGGVITERVEIIIKNN